MKKYTVYSTEEISNTQQVVFVCYAEDDEMFERKYMSKFGKKLDGVTALVVELEG